MQKVVGIIKQYGEIISYLFWGVMTTLVSWGTYSLFAVFFEKYAGLLQINISIIVLLSNILSWICAIIFAFYTNKRWVFRSKSWKKSIWIKEFGKFISSRMLTGVLEIFMVPLLVNWGMDQTILGIEGMVAKVVVSVAVVILNYIFSKLFVFK